MFNHVIFEDEDDDENDDGDSHLHREGIMVGREQKEDQRRYPGIKQS